MKSAVLSAAFMFSAAAATAATVDTFSLNMNANTGAYQGITGAMSSINLAVGVHYTVTVSGTFLISCQGQNTCPTDAEYYIAASDGVPYNYTGLSNTQGVGVDIGAALNDVKVDWGPYNPTREYSYDILGDGNKLKVTYIDTNHGDNRGSLTVTISDKMNVIPLPASIPLLLGGIGALALLRRQNMK